VNRIKWILLICMHNFMFCALEDPIVRKLTQIQKSLLTVGKSITAISIIVVILLFILGKPQWKWAANIMLGGVMLVSSNSIISWIIR